MFALVADMSLRIVAAAAASLSERSARSVSLKHSACQLLSSKKSAAAAIFLASATS